MHEVENRVELLVRLLEVRDDHGGHEQGAEDEARPSGLTDLADHALEGDALVLHADGAFGGGDDSEAELTFDATTTPALATGSWVSFDIPMSDFTTLAARASIAQLILSGDPNTVYVDNVYFYRTGAPTEPAVAAPVPIQVAASAPA